MRDCYEALEVFCFDCQWWHQDYYVSQGPDDCSAVSCFEGDSVAGSGCWVEAFYLYSDHEAALANFGYLGEVCDRGQ